MGQLNIKILRWCVSDSAKCHYVIVGSSAQAFYFSLSGNHLQRIDEDVKVMRKLCLGFIEAGVERNFVGEVSEYARATGIYIKIFLKLCFAAEAEIKQRVNGKMEIRLVHSKQMFSAQLSS